MSWLLLCGALILGLGGLPRQAAGLAAAFFGGLFLCKPIAIQPMRKILLPTDFSDNAAQALDYAVALANRIGSVQLTLFHTYEVHSNAGMFVSVTSFMQKDAADQVLKLIQKVEPALKNGVTLDSQILRGDTVRLITDFAQHNQYDLILMGTQGASGLQEIFLGSITNAVMQRAELPVLAVPSGYIFQAVDKIVFAVDEAGIAQPSITRPLVDLARALDVPVCVFHQAEPFEKDGIDPSIDIFLEGVEHSFHYELEEERIVDSINRFVADTGAQMLCMLRRRRGFLEEVFHVSVTTREVFNAPVP